MKVGGDQVVLVPRLSIFGGDASHGSHRVVAPMTPIRGNINYVIAENAEFENEGSLKSW